MELQGQVMISNKSFTIIEIVVAVVLMGIFAWGVSVYITQVVDSWKFLTQRYELEQNGKLAIDFIVRDIREIDIDSLGNPEISAASDTAITFTTADSETITYSYSANTIYKTISGNSQPLVKNVSSFSIQYYNKNYSEINPGGGSLSQGQRRQIWYLYVRFVLSTGDQTAVYSSYIFPRNLLAQ